MSNRTRHAVVTVLSTVLVASGCGQSDMEGDTASIAEPHEDTAIETSVLPIPFTAEQIRDEWIVGFEVIIRRNGPEGEFLERWRVVEADTETVSIENAVIDALGQPMDKPEVGRSGWDELRDHAKFPVDRGTRVRDRRQTALGELEGWLYVVDDVEGGGATHFFFADSLPGAPVEVEAVVGGEAFTVLEQIERFRPESADQG